jgi:hypothetical protein
MSTKTYINGLFIKKKTTPFESINVSINVAEFVQQIQANANEKGYCNIVFQNRKEADKNGNNMYAVLDTFVPKSQEPPF